MDRFEEAVLEYISAKPSRLLKAQFNISYDKEAGIGGSLPDFLALDFDEKCVYIIEVSTAWNINGLLNKVLERETRWYQPIRNSSESWAKISKEWDFRVCLVLRSEIIEKTKEIIKDYKDISLKSFDDVIFPWRWKWSSENIAVNPLRD